MSPRTLVLGAGLQGCCAALGLAGRGHEVVLVDQCPAPYRRTSIRGEGKVHLGLVYANDPSFQTAARMLRSALAFAPALERLLGHPVAWDQLVTAPFVYLVATDSMVSPGRLLEFYAALEARAREALDDPTTRYLGRRLEQLAHPVAHPPRVDPERVACAVQTAEQAVDPHQLRELVLDAVEAREEIQCLLGRRIRTIEEVGAGLRVSGEDAQGGPWRLDGDLVVNCLWSERVAFDRQLGMEPTGPWVHRLKYRILVETPPALGTLSPLTIVLGPYGDLVGYPRSGITYLSWYPTCLRGLACQDAPPRDWDALVDGRLPAPAQEEIARSTLDAFDEWVPGLGRARPLQVDAGVIVARGQTDITDLQSALHRRDVAGLRRRGGYLSVDTGKLTCAPANALELLAALDSTGD